MEEKIKEQNKNPSKKRNLTSTNLTDKNSFVVLGSDYIAEIAEGMGVRIPIDKFDTIDILKDIEVARHALDKKKSVISIQEIEDEIPKEDNNIRDIPLLEWLDEDSKEEKFTLV
jgi:hypothetical protein